MAKLIMGLSSNVRSREIRRWDLNREPAIQPVPRVDRNVKILKQKIWVRILKTKPAGNKK